MARQKLDSWSQIWLGTAMEFLLKGVLLSWLFTTVSSPTQRREEDTMLERVLRCASMPPERINTTAQVLEDVQRVMQERWPGSKVLMFGAVAADMATPDSDVDYFVELPEGTQPCYSTVAEARDVLASHPRLFLRLSTIPDARVPLVRFTHASTGHRCDISFTDREGVVQSQLLKFLFHLQPRARQLTVLVKQWAREHKPMHARRVMPNYALVLLVVFYLQQRRVLPPVALLQRHADTHVVDHWQMGYRQIPYASNDDATLFQWLSGFFAFYAHFDFENKIISPFSGTAIDRASFENVDTVPDIFDNYKRNVALNITEPLNITTPVCVQNFFNHMLNKADTTTPELLDHFRSALKRAAETTLRFREHSISEIFNKAERCNNIDIYTNTLL